MYFRNQLLKELVPYALNVHFTNMYTTNISGREALSRALSAITKRISLRT